MKEFFYGVLTVLFFPIGIIILVGTIIYEDSSAKEREERDKRVNSISDLLNCNRGHFLEGALNPTENQIYYTLKYGGLCIVAKDLFNYNTSSKWVCEYCRIMDKYHLDIMKNPTAEIYEAFRIELDPEYKAIVDKVNEGQPLTESERSLYEEIHYQKEA